MTTKRRRPTAWSPAPHGGPQRRLQWRESDYGGGLGRHIDHDPRSRLYRAGRLDLGAEPLHSIRHDRHVPILDQGDTSSCTGHADVGAVATDPLSGAAPASFRGDEQDALDVYSDAEKIDGGVGLPAQDAGSTGLSVAKASRARGWSGGWLNAFSVLDVYALLLSGPVLLGTYWWTGMDKPSDDGTVQRAGSIRGGHEVVLREFDAEHDRWWFDNSWSPAWGVKGRFCMSTATLTVLLGDDGDALQILPATAAPPVPGKETPNAADRELAAALADWVRGNHRGSNRTAQQAVRAWEDALGLATP